MRSANQLLVLLHLRRGVEIETAILAAKRREQVHIDRLEQNVARYFDIDSSEAGRSEVGHEFHRIVFDAAQSPLNSTVFSMLVPSMRSIAQALEIITSGHGTHGEAPREHQAILEAIRAADAELAGRCMGIHLGRFISEVESFVASTDAAVLEKLLTLSQIAGKSLPG